MAEFSVLGELFLYGLLENIIHFSKYWWDDRVCRDHLQIFTAAYICKHLSNILTLLDNSFHSKMEPIEKTQFCTYWTSDYKYTSITR